MRNSVEEMGQVQKILRRWNWQKSWRPVILCPKQLGRVTGQLQVFILYAWMNDDGIPRDRQLGGQRTGLKRNEVMSLVLPMLCEK